MKSRLLDLEVRGGRGVAVDDMGLCNGWEEGGCGRRRVVRCLIFSQRIDLSLHCFLHWDPSH